MRRHTGFSVEPGAPVFIHQAFRCCPYAGMITSQIHDYVERNGHRVVDDPAEAAVHIINTCGTDAAQAQLTFDALADVQGRAPGRPIVVAGCLNSIEPKRIAEALRPVTDHAMLDPRNLGGLDELFRPGAVPFEQVTPSLRNRYSGTEMSSEWYHVGVSTGCLGICTFCAIRRATGRPKSTLIPEVLAHIDRGVAEGKRDILLVSTDVSAWGYDIGLTVVDLLAAVAAHRDDVLISAEAFEPTLFLEHFERLLPILASGRFAFIGLPIQSGAQRILDLMQRPYRVEDVLAAVDRLRAAAPQLAVRTDIIYGFADETWEEFEASLAATRHFDVPSFNHYQERPGTAPATMSADDLIERRVAVMEELRRRGDVGQRQVRRWGTDSVAIASIVASETRELPREVYETPDEVLRWLRGHGRHFQQVIERKGPIALPGSGWTLRAATIDEQTEAIKLEIAQGERTFLIGLRKPGRPGRNLASSDRFGLYVATPDFRPDRGQDLAIKALIKMLALQPVPGA